MRDLLRKVLVCGSFSAYDGGLVLQQLSMLPVLQTLGVPLPLVTVSGVMSGCLTLLVLPLLGCLSDAGPTPRRRKQVTLVVSVAIYLSGLALVAAACVLHMVWTGGMPANPQPPTSVQSDVNSTSVVPWSASQFSAQDQGASALYPLVTEASQDALSPASTLPFPRYVILPIGSDVASPNTSDTSMTARSLTSESALTTDHEQRSPSTSTDLVFQSSSLTTANSTKRSPESKAWRDDPLGLGIPTQGILGIMGYVCIDMGNDCSNSCLKGFLLSTTPQEQHVTLLLVGVVMSAVGGGLTAGLGLLDLGGRFLAPCAGLTAVLSQTLLDAAFYLALTVLCTTLSLLIAPSSSQSQSLQKAAALPSPASCKGRAQKAFRQKEVSLTASVTSSPARIFTFHEAVLLTENGHEFSTWESCDQIFPRDDSLQISVKAKMEEKLSDLGVFDMSSLAQVESSDLYKDSHESTEDSAQEDQRHIHDNKNGALKPTNKFIPNSVNECQQSKVRAERLSRQKQDHYSPCEVPTLLIVCSSSSSSRFQASPDTKADVEVRSMLNISDTGTERQLGTNKFSTYGTLTTPEIDENQRGCGCRCRKASRTARRLALVCLSMFFMAGAWQSFNTCATDYLGKVVYGGDLEADPASQSYALYQRGLWTGALGVLILHAAYAAGNFMQKRLLQHIGSKAEYLIVCAVQVVVLVTLLLTDSVYAYYVTSVAVGLFRSVMYTVPFLLANDLCQEQAQALRQDGGVIRSGTVMAAVTSMLPVSMVIVCSLTGPLIETTGTPASPLYYTTATTAAAALVFAFT